MQFEQWVPGELTRVFLFFANPQNLPRIMPLATAIRLEQITLRPPAPGGHESRAVGQLAGVGSEVITSFQVLPFLPLRVRWIARITEFEWEHHFADVQARGPFKSFHHRHEFAASMKNGTAGTTVRDVIEYEAGYGYFGRAAENLWIAGQLQRTFEYRQGALEALLKSGG